MDCSTCRSLFSESFDGRIAGERRQHFLIHVQACVPCENEFALYRRVFGTIRALPDGDAPPFQMPAEVPGAMASSHRFSGRPRFARAAAGILLLIGLVGTHVAVFNWSKEHATPGQPRVAPVAPPVLAAQIPGVLPSALRDHVEATDLFIRSAALASQLPEEAGARVLAEADWATSDLPQRTRDLRAQTFNTRDQAQIERYLKRSEDFVARARKIITEPCRESCVRALCKAAMQSGVVFDLESMRPIVASLPVGTSFPNFQVAPPVMRLSPDGRLLLEAKYARLSGEFSRAIEGFESFDKQFAGKSRLTPLGLYFHADALHKAGRYADATKILNSLRQAQPRSWIATDAGAQSWQPFCVTIVVGGMGNTGSMSVFRAKPSVLQVGIHGVEGPTMPMKSELIQPLVETGLAPELPKR